MTMQSTSHTGAIKTVENEIIYENIRIDLDFEESFKDKPARGKHLKRKSNEKCCGKFIDKDSKINPLDTYTLLIELKDGRSRKCLITMYNINSGYVKFEGTEDL